MPDALAPFADRRRTAFLTIDVQNDFCHPDGARARGGRDLAAVTAMVPRLEAALAAARQANVPVIHVQIVNSPWTDSPIWAERAAFAGGLQSPCQTGTWGADFFGLVPLPDEYVLVKRRYSAFVRTELETVLASRGIQNLVLTGVTSHVCVESTARHAFMLDYRVLALDDCCAAYAPQDHAVAMENIARYFGHVCASADLLRAWQALSAPA
jgi:ureidoacrylate peracid hydrolase